MAPAQQPSVDLLRCGAVGRTLKRRATRTAARCILLGLAALMIWDGLTGPELAPKNLATVWTWVHYRGLLVAGLLAAGNLFCYACPFILVRDWGRKLIRPRWVWPARLRSKWPAIVLFVLILFSYEVFDLWAAPALTAGLIGAYFIGALVVDLLFRNASFCKYVCPIGQFNFVTSTVSPLEVSVRDPAICERCTTRDCIRGRRDPKNPLHVIQRGCELSLFQPRKVGNLDCTFCLDCVYACPHDNIGIQSRLQGLELWIDPIRSGIGRISRRPDLTALILLFTFGALLNAFGMVSPVYAVHAWLARNWGLHTEAASLSVLFLAALVVEPFLLLGAASAASRSLARMRTPLIQVALQFAPSLVPIGAGVWVAHYMFHFLTGILTWIPVLQRALIDLGLPLLGRPIWTLGGLPPGRIYPIEIGFLLLGLSGSLLVSRMIGLRLAPERPWAAALPWMALHTLLFIAAAWLLAQPMEMRGSWPGA